MKSSSKKVLFLSSLAMLVTFAGCETCKDWSVEKDRYLVNEALGLMKNGGDKSSRKKAKSVLKDVLKCRSKNAERELKYSMEYEAYYLLGKIQSWSDGDRDEAIINLQKAANINPDDPDVGVALGNALLWEGNAKSDLDMLYKARDVFNSIRVQNQEQRDAVNDGLRKGDDAIDRVKSETNTNY